MRASNVQGSQVAAHKHSKRNMCEREGPDWEVHAGPAEESAGIVGSMSVPSTTWWIYETRAPPSSHKGPLGCSLCLFLSPKSLTPLCSPQQTMVEPLVLLQHGALRTTFSSPWLFPQYLFCLACSSLTPFQDPFWFYEDLSLDVLCSEKHSSSTKKHPSYSHTHCSSVFCSALLILQNSIYNIVCVSYSVFPSRMFY